jgi:hypothetical protein
MVETIQRIQDKGILVLSSIICGLESDSLQSMRAMRDFAIESGTTLAQFTIYRPYPGTKDYFEMMQDRQRAEASGHRAKHGTRIVSDRFWLDRTNPVDWFQHATLATEDLLRENRACWDRFYSLPEILKRARFGVARSWPLAGRLAYVFLSIIFHRVYAGHGVSADNVQKKKGRMTRLFIHLAVGVYNHFFRQTRVGFEV